MGIRLVCILHRPDDSAPVRQELSSSEVPLRAWEKEMHVRGSEVGWTSHSPNLYSGSVCRSAEAPASGPGTNSIADSWLAGKQAVALGKEKKSLLSLKKDRGEKGCLPLDWTRPVAASRNLKDQIRLKEEENYINLFSFLQNTPSIVITVMNDSKINAFFISTYWTFKM